MIPVMIFAILSVCLILVLLYFLDRLWFYRKEVREFQEHCLEIGYLNSLRSRLKRVKRKYRKNLLLYLIYKALKAQGEEKKASDLSPFLRPDPFYGIITEIKK